MIRSHLRVAHVLAATCVLFLAACGSDATSVDAEAPDAPEQSDSGQPSESPGTAGRGAATLTIGEQTWDFDNVQCAVGSDATNSADWDFSMAASIGGLQLIVDRAAPEGRFGDTISMFGGEIPTDQGVSWEAPAPDLTGGTPIQNSFVVVDGKNVTAETTFWNDLDATGVAVPGSLTAQCP